MKALAGINGELGYLEGKLALCTAGSEQCAALDVQRARVAADREALCATIRQCDPSLDPTAIGYSQVRTKRRSSRLACSPPKSTSGLNEKAATFASSGL